MKKILQKFLLLTVMFAAGVSAWGQTTTVGADDNSTSYLGAKSEAYDLSENGTWTFNFTNYNSGTGGTYQNWLLECNNGSKDLFVLRADKFENVAWSNNNTTWSDDAAWTDFVAKMNGASISMTVTRNAQHILVTVNTTPSTGDAFTYTYNYYNASGDMNLYLSVEAAHIVITNATWTAADTKAITIISQDYESYSDNDDIKSDLQSAGWTFQTATGCNLYAVAKQETLNESPSVVNKYARFNYTGSRAHRWQRWDFNVSSNLNTDNWTLSFNATLTSSNTNGTAELVVAGTSTTGIATNADACNNPFFKIANGGSNAKTTYNATIGSSTVGDPFTIEANTWYRYTIKLTDIDNENSTATVSVSIDKQDGTNVFSNTQTNISTASIGMLRGIAWNAIKGGSWLYLDNVILTKNVSTAICAAPTYQLTGSDGASRKFTLTCETSGSTIYYASSNIEKGAAGWTTYSSEVTTAEGTIYAYASKGSASSDVISFSTGAGEAVQLLAPTISRSSENLVTITADQSSLGFDVTPIPTIYYTYGGEPIEYTGAITVSADATLSTYAVLDGYTTSNVVSRALAPKPTTSTMVLVENAPSVTSGNATVSFSNETTSVGGTTYAALLLGENQWSKNVYFETTANRWGFRTNNSGSWYVNSTSKLLMKNMKAGDIIYVNSDYQASAQTNSTYSEKYTYSNMYAYVVDEDGDVTISLTKPSAMHYFYGVYVYSNYEPMTVSSAGYATYVSDYDLDFSSSDIKAYKVKVNTKGVATLTQLDQVPSGTPVLLYKEGGATESIPVTTGAAAVTENDLVAGTGGAVATTDGDYTNMILNNVSGIGFYYAAGQTVATNRAYLHILTTLAPDPETNARMRFEFGNGEATGIENIATEQNAFSKGIYTLSGQRVSKPSKGLYIIDGKKVMVK